MKLGIITTVLSMTWFAMSVSAQIKPGDVNIKAYAPDLSIAGISRVMGKNELKVIVANTGPVKGTKAKLKVYALPYGFVASLAPYPTPPLQPHVPAVIPQGQRFESTAMVKYRLALAWASVTTAAFDLASGAKVEQIVKVPPANFVDIGQPAKTVYPVPYFQESSSHLYAPRSLATFDLSVFYAVVEVENEVNKANNDYFFNVRSRG